MSVSRFLNIIVKVNLKYEHYTFLGIFPQQKTVPLLNSRSLDKVIIKVLYVLKFDSLISWTGEYCGNVMQFTLTV